MIDRAIKPAAVPESRMHMFSKVTDHCTWPRAAVAGGLGTLFALLLLILAGDTPPGELRLMVSSVSSNRVSVILTNTSRTSVEYFLRPWNSSDKILNRFRVRGKLEGFGEATLERMAFSTNRWRLVVNYASTLEKPFGSGSPTSGASFRASAARYARNRNWTRLSRWLEPPPSRVRTVFGPYLVGNELAAENTQ